MNQMALAQQIHANRKTLKAQLDEFYSCFASKDSVLITIDPDPDAIGSALAVKRLLWHKVASTSIGIIRPVRRLNNLAMVRLLRVPLLALNTLDTSRLDKFVLVDGQPSHNDLFSRFHYTVVIDHHRQTDTVKADLCDVRPEYGSTSTIMTQYLIAAKIKPSLVLATA